MSSIHLTRREPWEAQLRRASELGFWGIEVFGGDLVAGNLTDPSVLGGLRTTSERLGLALTAHPWFDWACDAIDDNVDRLRELLERCRQMSVRMVNIHLSFLAVPADGCERAAKIVAPLLSTLVANDQELYFENVPGFLENPLGSQPGEFLEFFRLLAYHPRIGFNLDVGHAHATGNLPRFIRELRRQWRYTHLHDNNGAADEHLAPGMGSVDWAGFARTLKSVQYGGPFVLEFPERFLPQGGTQLAPLFIGNGWHWPEMPAVLPGRTDRCSMK